jgi:sortase A
MLARWAKARKARLLGTACIVTGLALFAYAGYLIWDPGAGREQHRLAGQLQRQWHRPGAPATTRPAAGQPFAFLTIPRLGPHWRFAIVQGTTPAALAKGPGHVAGTQLPGQRGNFAVAGHDLTAGNPFLHLASLRPGDPVIVTTATATYRYRTLSERVVRYTDVAVLDAVPGHPRRHPRQRLITLITCTPVSLSFTPYRVIVTGVLASQTPGSPAGGPQRG